MTAITTAIRLLREAATELKSAHTLAGDWGDEHEALDAYNEHIATASELERLDTPCLHQISEPAAVAGPAPVGWRLVPAEPTSKQICLMTGAILGQPKGMADNRDPRWLTAAKTAEAAYQAAFDYAPAAPALEAPAAPASEQYDELHATLMGLRVLCENISSMERRVGPLGSHARGYTWKITEALRHLDALAAAPQAPAAPTAVVPDAWQPIETAPKNGRLMLLGYINSCGKWRTARGQWINQEYIDEYAEDPELMSPGWYETTIEDDDGKCWPIEPTRWQPLPPPPQGFSNDQ